MLTSSKRRFNSISNLIWFIAIGTLLCEQSQADVPRPLGVALTKATLYKPGSGDTWECLDGSKTLKYVQINDDYCDCTDGSDEPGTAACPQATFHCVNQGHRSQDLPSSRVNDGICDCCDGSDEYEVTRCPNQCDELGRAEREQRKSQAEMLRRGAAKRSEMVAKGQHLKTERERRRQELEQRRQEQETLKKEKEELKSYAEYMEAEAVAFFKEIHKESEAAVVDTPTESATAKPEDSLLSEAAQLFSRYDTNKDGYVEIIELQVDINLDRDRNGMVSSEEAKYYLDERDRIDLESFVALSWPRIKPMLMVAQGIFKPPHSSEDDDEEEADAGTDTEHYQNAELDDMLKEYNERGEEITRKPTYQQEEEEEEEAYEDDEADVGEGTVENTNTPEPEYDEGTKHLIQLANEARNAFSEVERSIREIEQEIKEIDDQDSKDYGPHDEYATLEGECFKFEDREYVYTLCPFERASQQGRGGGGETTLGRWDQWLHEGERKYTKQKYAHGASCWNGPQRSAIVQLRCALESKITSVSEPNRCEYFFEFETPAACDEEAFHAEEQRFKDEL
ncbi:glucosidase 2 subunit beta [Stomoxys calcitrans]|uniref:Glucosidase 2 subunit beta n=1 Tax=Stomoxys calcitrans TaxID=35570 RepID=A0A1I8PIA2_STOCA|nr:glucosidase 2 subunit beta [Stomoxys calcitrans]